MDAASDTCCHKAREGAYSFVMSCYTILLPVGVAVRPRTVRTFINTFMYVKTYPSRRRDGNVLRLPQNVRKCARTRTLRPPSCRLGTRRGRVGRSGQGAFLGTIVQGVTPHTPMGRPKSLAHPCNVSTRFPFRAPHGGGRVHSACRWLLSVDFLSWALFRYATVCRLVLPILRCLSGLLSFVPVPSTGQRYHPVDGTVSLSRGRDSGIWVTYIRLLHYSSASGSSSSSLSRRRDGFFHLSFFLALFPFTYFQWVVYHLATTARGESFLSQYSTSFRHCFAHLDLSSNCKSSGTDPQAITTSAYR